MPREQEKTQKDRKIGGFTLFYLKESSYFSVMSIEVFYRQFQARSVSRLCALFQAAAFDTWERIWFSRRTPGLKIHETTITQNLVYEMNLLKDRLNIGNLYIYESRNEAANGNDLDLIIRQPRGHLYRYMIQSKILYHSIKQRKVVTHADGIYQQLHHKSVSGPQVKVLIERAESANVRAVPLYLLYNFVTLPPIGQAFCGVQVDGSQFGCSVVSAHVLRNLFSDRSGNLRRRVRFSHLHNGLALPWMVLACCLPKYTAEQTLKLFQINPNYEMKDYTSELRNNQSQWILLPPLPSAQRPTESFKESTKGFLPKYRIVIEGA